VKNNRPEQECKTVLLIEDNPDHVELISISMRKAFPATRLISYYDGQEALAAIGLIPDAKADGALRPDLVLLDMNLPRFGGLEVLRRIRADQRFDDMPVVILTTSALKEDIETMLQLGANAFVTKSEAGFHLEKKIQMLFSQQSVQPV